MAAVRPQCAVLVAPGFSPAPPSYPQPAQPRLPKAGSAALKGAATLAMCGPRTAGLARRQPVGCMGFRGRGLNPKSQFLDPCARSPVAGVRLP
jgi:hypothetical protein